MIGTGSSSTRLQVDELEGREVPAILFGVTTTNQLVVLDSANPNVILRSIPLTLFLAPGEVITDIDVRPATGGLYGHSSLGRLLEINPISALAIPVGNSVTPTVPNIGMDFDPNTDRLRILTSQRDNLVVDPSDGTLSRTGAPLAYLPGDPAAGIAPHITGAAFTNNDPNLSSHFLLAIDHARDTLVRVGKTSLNDGLLTTIGSLGADVTNRVGFDIAPQSNVAFASLQKAGQGFSKLFTIDTSTGQATRIGRIGGGILLNDIAVDTRGTSGFVSTAGFFAFPPPPPVFGAGLTTAVTPGFGTPDFSSFSSFNIISPFGPPITTPNLFPSLIQPLPGTVISPFFMGGTFPTTTTSGTGTFF